MAQDREEIAMSRIPALDPAAAQGKARDLLDAVQKSLGITPNMFRVAAQSPAALEGLLGLNGAVAHGTLGPKVREQIALAVAENNRCDYCLSAHTFLGKHAGLSDADVARARQGRAADLKADAAVRFAQSLLESRGNPSDADLAAARRAGFSDGEIVEVVALTALNVFTNYLNRVAETDIDFPVVRSGIGAAA
jgi:uncharacterized peroxidase-related enzyme